MVVQRGSNAIAVLIAICLADPSWVGAQSRAGGAAPAFEVASVKPVKSGDPEQDRDHITSSPGSLLMQNISLSSCIRWAYGLQPFQINGPAWLNSEKYNISAKAGQASKDDQMRVMLQALLTERFRLVFHRETKELQTYALLVGKNGHKLVESKGEGGSSMKPGRFGFAAQKTSMAQLTEYLALPLRRPVMDLTGLTGRYDFALDLTRYANGDGQPADIASMVLTAVPDQLGLRLEGRKGPVEILVVDRAEKVPTGN